MPVVTKSMLAARLGVSKARITQFCHLGMPVLPDGKVDLIDAADWIICTIDPGRDVPSLAVVNAKRILARRPALTDAETAVLRKALMTAR
jgi:hypothetical protein